MAGEFLKLKIKGDKEVKARLDKINSKLIVALRVGIHKSLLELQGAIVRKLSGQVLNVRTNRLRGSWASSEALNVSQRGETIIGTIGSNVVYAAIHEFGGMAGRGRKVKIPARPYARPSLEEKQNRIIDLVNNEIRKLVES